MRIRRAAIIVLRCVGWAIAIVLLLSSIAAYDGDRPKMQLGCVEIHNWGDEVTFSGPPRDTSIFDVMPPRWSIYVAAYVRVDRRGVRHDVLTIKVAPVLIALVAVLSWEGIRAFRRRPRQHGFEVIPREASGRRRG